MYSMMKGYLKWYKVWKGVSVHVKAIYSNNVAIVLYETKKCLTSNTPFSHLTTWRTVFPITNTPPHRY